MSVEKALEIVARHLEEAAKEIRGLGVAVESSPAWGFDPQEFVDYKNWKSRKNSDGTYAHGSLDWGWEFLYADRERTQSNFSKEAVAALERGSVQIGDDYEVSLNESKALVQIKKLKK